MDKPNETIADIIREMRTYFQTQKRNGNPERRPWHQVLSDWADRIEAAAKRKMDAIIYSFDPTKADRSRAPDPCAYALEAMEPPCVATTGNAAAMREDDANLSSWDGVDAQIDALKRLARTRVGGHECAMPCAEFADTVERLDAARKRELASRDKTSFHCGDCAKFGFDCGAGDVDGNEDCIACDKFRRRAAPGNNAALREALMNAKLYFDHRGEGTNLDDAGMAIDAITSIYVAISAPQRNCDVGTPEEQARRFDAFCGAHHFQSEKCCSDCPCQGAECEFKWSQMPYDKIEERIRKEATHE